MNDLKELKNLAENLTVLYVEDDTDIANTMISYLSKFFKEVVYAVNGEDGLNLYKQSNFDLVITDIKMPKLDGLEMISEIKIMKNEQSVIIVSAYSEIDNFLTSIKLGVDGYIIKPVNYADMNNILYKISKKVSIEKDIAKYRLNQKELISQVKNKNHELEQYIDAIGKVAIVSKTDLNGNITYVNKFFCEASGYSKSELIGRNHNIVRHPDVSKAIFKNLWETIQNGKVWEGNIKNKNKSEEAYYLHVTVIPLFESDKKTLNEYMSIGFITTKEEMEKREFKKSVITNYQEFKKENFNANRRIKELENELTSLKNNSAFLTDSSQGNKQKLQQLQSQVFFYEKEISKMKMKHEKIIEMFNSNTRNLTQLNNKYMQKIEQMKKEVEHYQKEYEVSKKEVLRVENELQHQRKVIADLKDTIKNIVEEEEELKEELNPKSKLDVFKDFLKKD